MGNGASSDSHAGAPRDSSRPQSAAAGGARKQKMLANQAPRRAASTFASPAAAAKAAETSRQAAARNPEAKSAALQRVAAQRRRADAHSSEEDAIRAFTRNADPTSLKVLQLIQQADDAPQNNPAEKLRLLRQCYPLLQEVPKDRFDQLAVAVYQQEGEIYYQQMDIENAKDTFSRAITLAEKRVARQDSDMYMVLKRYVLAMIGMARIWYDHERDHQGFHFADHRHPKVPAAAADGGNSEDGNSSLTSLESSLSSAGGSVFSLNEAILHAMAPRPPRRQTGPLFRRMKIQAPHTVKTTNEMDREDAFVLHSRMTRELIASPCELLLLRCCEVVQIGHNAQSELLIPAQIELAQIYEDLALYSRALLLVRRCLGILCSVYDYDHPWVIQLMQRADRLQQLLQAQLEKESATKIQATWKMHKAMQALADALGRPVRRHQWIPRRYRTTPDLDYLGDFVGDMPDNEMLGDGSVDPMDDPAGWAVAVPQQDVAPRRDPRQPLLEDEEAEEPAYAGAVVEYAPTQHSEGGQTFTAMVPNANVIGTTQDTQTDTNVQHTEYGDVLTVRTTTVTKTITEDLDPSEEEEEEEEEESAGDYDDDEEEAESVDLVPPPPPPPQQQHQQQQPKRSRQAPTPDSPYAEDDESDAPPPPRHNNTNKGPAPPPPRRPPHAPSPRDYTADSVPQHRQPHPPQRPARGVPQRRDEAPKSAPPPHTPTASASESRASTSSKHYHHHHRQQQQQQQAAYSDMSVSSSTLDEVPPPPPPPPPQPQHRTKQTQVQPRGHGTGTQTRSSPRPAPTPPAQQQQQQQQQQPPQKPPRRSTAGTQHAPEPAPVQRRADKGTAAKPEDDIPALAAREESPVQQQKQPPRRAPPRQPPSDVDSERGEERDRPRKKEDVASNSSRNSSVPPSRAVTAAAAAAAPPPRPHAPDLLHNAKREPFRDLVEPTEVYPTDANGAPLFLPPLPFRGGLAPNGVPQVPNPADGQLVVRVPSTGALQPYQQNRAVQPYDPRKIDPMAQPGMPMDLPSPPNGYPRLNQTAPLPPPPTKRTTDHTIVKTRIVRTYRRGGRRGDSSSSSSSDGDDDEDGVFEEESGSSWETSGNVSWGTSSNNESDSGDNASDSNAHGHDKDKKKPKRTTHSHSTKVTRRKDKGNTEGGSGSTKDKKNVSPKANGEAVPAAKPRPGKENTMKPEIINASVAHNVKHHRHSKTTTTVRHLDDDDEL